MELTDGSSKFLQLNECLPLGFPVELLKFAAIGNACDSDNLLPCLIVVESEVMSGDRSLTHIRHIAEEIGVNVDEMVIVDDSNFHTIGVAQEILKENGILWKIEPGCYLAGLKDTSRWFYDGNKYTVFKPSHPHKCKDQKGAYNISNATYLYFKKWMWKRGYVSFDDILYLVCVRV